MPPASRSNTEGRSGDGRASGLIRWAAFSCVLVPVALLWCGTSLAGATGTASGLAAVAAVCRVLLRRSERCTAGPPADEHPQNGGARGARHTEGNTPVG